MQLPCQAAVEVERCRTKTPYPGGGTRVLRHHGEAPRWLA